MAAAAPLAPPRPTTGEPVRRSVRRLRWFKGSFTAQVDALSRETGVAFDVSDRALAASFLDWLRAFEAQKPSDREAQRDYVGFAAGLMLGALLRHRPLAARDLPAEADTTNPAYFWPEGYVYVAYCLNIRALVLEQDFHEDRDTAPEFSEIRVWWSFRENAAEDPGRAAAFLDLFSGETPHWRIPDLFRDRTFDLSAPRFYAPRRITDEA